MTKTAATICLALAVLHGISHEAKAAPYMIEAVDPAAEQITLQEGHRLKTYRLSMRVEVTLNGEKASLADITPQMKAIAFTLEDAQTISKIEVNGLPRNAAHSPKVTASETPRKPSAQPEVSQAALKSITDKLAGTYWTYPFPKRSDSDTDTDKYWIRLNADGTASASWHSMSGSWKVVGKDTLQLQITGHDISNGSHEILRFDPGLTMLGDNHERLSQPTGEMKNKVSAPAGTQ